MTLTFRNSGKPSTLNWKVMSLLGSTSYRVVLVVAFITPPLSTDSSLYVISTGSSVVRCVRGWAVPQLWFGQQLRCHWWLGSNWGAIGQQLWFGQQLSINWAAIGVQLGSNCELGCDWAAIRVRFGQQLGCDLGSNWGVIWEAIGAWMGSD